MDELTRLFSSYDRGTISRRHLLQALGLVGTEVFVGSGCEQRNEDGIVIAAEALNG